MLGRTTLGPSPWPAVVAGSGVGLGGVRPGNSERRWLDEAQSLLIGSPSESARRRLRRRQTKVWSIVVGAGVLAVAAGALAAVLVSHHAEWDTDLTVPLWRAVVGYSVAVCGVIVEVVAVVRLVRAGVVSSARSAPISVLTRRQQRQLRKQVRGQLPPVPAELALARDLSTRLARQRPLVLLFVGLAGIQAGQALTNPSRLLVTLASGQVLLCTICLPLMQRDINRAELFLRRHPDPGTGPPATLS